MIFIININKLCVFYKYTIWCDDTTNTESGIYFVKIGKILYQEYQQIYKIKRLCYMRNNKICKIYTNYCNKN